MNDHNGQRMLACIIHDAMAVDGPQRGWSSRPTDPSYM